MALTVVTGPASAGKTRELHGAIEASLEAGEVPVLIVPSVPDKQRFAEEFADKGVCGPRVEVFDRWFAEQWALHGDGRLLVGEFARRVLVSRAVCEARLNETSLSARYAGFRSLIVTLARDMSHRDEDSSQPTRADLEIAAILSTYQALLDERGLVEPAHAARILSERAPVLPGPVAFNRFNDLSAAQEVLLVGLSRRNEVLIALTWERGHPATEAASGLVERLVRHGRHQIVHVAGEPVNELAQVERLLFRLGGTVRAEGALRVIGAPDVEAEFVTIARAVSELLESGTAPREIAVVFREPARRLHLLARLERAVGVPVDVDVAVLFSQTPYGAAFLALLRFATGAAMDTNTAAAFVASPYAGLGAEAAETAIDGWRRHRIEGYQLLDEFEKLGGGAATSVALARGLTRHAITTQHAAKWQELADGLLAGARTTRPHGTPGSALDVAAHAAVCALISSALDVERDQPVCEELLEALGDTRVSTKPGAIRDGVVVTEVHRLQSRRFEAVIVGGLSGSEFSPDRPDSLARETAVRLGITTLPDTHLAERLRFYSVLTRARQRIVLTHPTGGVRADSERMSAFIDEVLDLYRTDDERSMGQGPRQHGLNAYRELDTGAETADVSAIVESAQAGPARGRLTDPRCQTLAAHAAEYSISEIETYIACPYRWFTQYVVRVRSRKGQLGPAELGSLSHRMLAEFYRRWAQDEVRGRVVPRDRMSARRVLDSVWEECHGEMTPHTMEELHSLARVHERVRALVDDDATFLPGFEPHRHEFAFGSAAERPFAFAGVSIVGSIDRIDRSQRGLVVSDYKSGSDIKGHATWARAGLLQLPVYAAAAQQLLGEPVVGAVYRSLASLKVRGAWIEEAAQLGSRGPKSDGVDSADIEALIADAESRAAKALEGIRAGLIPARPAREASCSYCPVAAVCTRGQ